MLATMSRTRERSGESEVTLYENGFGAGQCWAEIASPAELVLLEDLRQRTASATGSDWAFFFDSNGAAHAFTTAERLYFAMHPEHDEVVQKAREFWQRILGKAARLTRNDNWLHGFAEGALSTWTNFERRICC
jgi:hypothetical protein